MKTDIHPAYHDKIKATCVCGASFVVGSTMPEMKMEICSACHPFYTGAEKVLDAAGRVERFKKRASTAAAMPKKGPKKPRTPKATEA